MSGIASTTYPSTDEAMLGAEAAYAGMEAELQNYLDTYESRFMMTRSKASAECLL